MFAEFEREAWWKGLSDEYLLSEFCGTICDDVGVSFSLSVIYGLKVII